MRSSDARTRHMVLMSLMSAIIVITTMFIAIPIPNITGAYINGGDAAVYASAYVLGGVWGAVCAGVGSALADVLLGSVVYAPATLIIKGAMALCAAVLIRRLGEKRTLIAVAAAGLIMPLGYFFYECVLVGAAVAATGVVFNLIQYVAGTALGVCVITGLKIIKVRSGGDHND